MAPIITLPNPYSLEIHHQANELLSPNIRTEKELFAVVLRHLVETTHIQDAWVVQYVPERDYLLRMTGTGIYADDRPEGPLLDGCPVGQGVSGLAYQTRRVVYITDYHRWANRLAMVPRNIRYAVASPIFTAPQEQPYGVLACCGDQPDILDTLTSFVTQYSLILGLALSNIKLRRSLCTAEVSRERIAAMASRMEAIFYAASSIVHDFRNMLMAISGRAEILERNLESPQGLQYESAKRNIQAIQDACALNNSVCETLLRVIREPNSIEPQETTIAPLMFKLERVLRPFVHHKGRLTIDASCQPTTTLLIREESVMRLLMNLVTNAVEAAHPERELEVTLRIFECTCPGMDQCGTPSEGTHVITSGDCGTLSVVFDVSDTGQGIPRETAERMFDLLYSTKEKGTGLGLPTVYSIVKDCGGNLSYSTSPEGTRFRVCIPAKSQTQLPGMTPIQQSTHCHTK